MGGDENSSPKSSRWGLERKSTKEGGLLHSLFHPSRSQSNASSAMVAVDEDASQQHTIQKSDSKLAAVQPASPNLSALMMPTVSKLTSSLNGLTGLFHQGKASHFKLPQWGEKKDSEHSDQSGNDEKKLYKTTSDVSLAAKWGTCQEVIGKGAFGVVRIAHKVDPSVPGTGERLYAVKEFKKRNDETPKQYIKRLTSEFCISSTLHHRNIIQTLDLLPSSGSSSTYCQVMDYCNGGDLFHLIFESSGGLETAEANCFFKQLIRGVEYLHRMGVSHRDLKPENLLLTTDGCLKISDFGSSECFRMAWEAGNGKKNGAIHGSTGLCGSEPYIAPEQFEKGEFDPRLVDIWSCAVIYMAMRTGKHLWHVARPEDQHYERYLMFRNLVDEERDKARRMRSLHRTCTTEEERIAEAERTGKERNEGVLKARETIRRKAKEAGCDVLEGLEFGAKKLIYRMLDPKPSRRIFASEILKNEWFASIYCCQPTDELQPRTIKPPCADQTSVASSQSVEPATVG
ncbi:serine/threonine-protein kinase HAL4/sat4 [Umbelopsis nana]